MNPPTEQLIRDYLNRVSVAALGRLSSEERREFLTRTREELERETRYQGGADTLAVARLLDGLGRPEALVELERARLTLVQDKPVPAARRLRRLVTRPAAWLAGRPARRPAESPPEPPEPPEQDAISRTPMTGEIKVVSRPITARRRPGHPLQPRPSGRTGASRRQAPSPGATGDQQTGGPAGAAPDAGAALTGPGPDSGAASGEGQGPDGPADSNLDRFLAMLGGQQDPAQPDGKPAPAQPAGPAAEPGGPARGPGGPGSVPVPGLATDEPVPAPGPGGTAGGPDGPGPAPGPGGPAGGPGGPAGGPGGSVPAPGPAGSTPGGPERAATPGAAASGAGGSGSAAGPGGTAGGPGVTVPAPRSGEHDSGQGQARQAPGPGGQTAAFSGGQQPGTRRLVGLPGTGPDGDTAGSTLAAAAGRTGRAAAAFARRQPVEAAAVVLLGLGGLIFPPIWLLGVLVALLSRLWDFRDKWLGLAGPPLLVIAGTIVAVAVGGKHSSIGGYAHEAWLAADYLSRIAAVASAVFLAWRARPDRRQPPVPPWSRPRRI